MGCVKGARGALSGPWVTPGPVWGPRAGPAVGWGRGCHHRGRFVMGGLFLGPAADSRAAVWPEPSVSEAAGGKAGPGPGHKCWPPRGVAKPAVRAQPLGAGLVACVSGSGHSPCCLPPPSSPLLPDPRGLRVLPELPQPPASPTDPRLSQLFQTVKFPLG